MNGGRFKEKLKRTPNEDGGENAFLKPDMDFREASWLTRDNLPWFLSLSFYPSPGLHNSIYYGDSPETNGTIR